MSHVLIPYRLSSHKQDMNFYTITHSTQVPTIFLNMDGFKSNHTFWACSTIPPLYFPGIPSKHFIHTHTWHNSTLHIYMHWYVSYIFFSHWQILPWFPSNGRGRLAFASTYPSPINHIILFTTNLKILVNSLLFFFFWS